MAESTPRETSDNEPIPGTDQDENTPLLQSSQTSPADTSARKGASSPPLTTRTKRFFSALRWTEADNAYLYIHLLVTYLPTPRNETPGFLC